MDIISMIVSIVVLGILYKRMIDREVPEKIGTLQAIVPAGLGVASLWLSFFLTVGTALLIGLTGYSRSAHPMWVQSLVSAFTVAGFPEEIGKFLMIAISLLLFRKRIRNVYEYVLIGAAVGAGFTIFEEFLYGGVSSPLSMIFRLLLIAIHMMLNMIMGYYIGKARYQRVTGTGGAFWSYVLAFIIPIALHTIHDATTGMNSYLLSDNSAHQDTGIIIGIVGAVIFFSLQFFVFRQFKKKAEELSMMRVLPQEAVDTNMADTADAADTTDAPDTADAADTSNNA